MTKGEQLLQAVLLRHKISAAIYVDPFARQLSAKALPYDGEVTFALLDDIAHTLGTKAIDVRGENGEDWGSSSGQDSASILIIVRDVVKGLLT